MLRTGCGLFRSAPFCRDSWHIPEVAFRAFSRRRRGDISHDSRTSCGSPNSRNPPFFETKLCIVVDSVFASVMRFTTQSSRVESQSSAHQLRIRRTSTWTDPACSLFILLSVLWASDAERQNEHASSAIRPALWTVWVIFRELPNESSISRRFHYAIYATAVRRHVGPLRLHLLFSRQFHYWIISRSEAGERSRVWGINSRGRGGQDAHLKLVFEILAYTMQEVDALDYMLLLTTDVSYYHTVTTHLSA